MPQLFYFFSPVTLFELTVVNNWYITMVRSNYLSVVRHWSVGVVVKPLLSPLFTGRSHFHDEPLEPALLHDLLYRYHGEGCAASVSSEELCSDTCGTCLIVCSLSRW